jgi:large subunit ribosomal protein L17
MRHMMRGRQLSRDTEHRKFLRRSLVQSLFEHGKIRTTEPKAKEVRAFAEKLITLARLGTLVARRRVLALLNDRELVDEKQDLIGKTVVQRLFDEIAPKFVGRSGGYTRVIKLSDHRIGDGGSLVLLQLVDETVAPKGTIRRSAGLRRKRTERLRQFANQLRKGAAGKADPDKATAEKAATKPAEGEGAKA